MIMARTLIGNIKGANGRGISKIEKTATTGDVDIYTITYTDGTTSTYDVHNGDTIAVQRQIVPSAEIESSTTATKSYEVGDYLILNGVLRKVTASIAKGSTISDSNSAATTVTGEVATAIDTVSKFKSDYEKMTVGSGYIELCRVGGIVTMNMFNITASISGSWDTKLVNMIPEGFRPKSDIRQRCLVANADDEKSAGLWIKSSGAIYVANFGGSGLSGEYEFSCTACWPAS